MTNFCERGECKYHFARSMRLQTLVSKYHMPLFQQEEMAL